MCNIGLGRNMLMSWFSISLYCKIMADTYEALQDWAELLCESHSIEQMLSQCLKSYWSHLWYIPKKIQSLPLFARMNFGSSNYLTILFDNFEDMLWGSGGLGCMRVAFESVFFLVTKKIIYVAKSKNWLFGSEHIFSWKWLRNTIINKTSVEPASLR